MTSVPASLTGAATAVAPPLPLSMRLSSGNGVRRCRPALSLRGPSGSLRMALIAPIQGSAADIIKLAMLRVDAALRETGLGSRQLLQVHDELVLEIAPGERADVEALVRREMGGAIAMDVPLEVSVGVGHSWHDAAH